MTYSFLTSGTKVPLSLRLFMLWLLSVLIVEHPQTLNDNIN